MELFIAIMVIMGLIIIALIIALIKMNSRSTGNHVDSVKIAGLKEDDGKNDKIESKPAINASNLGSRFMGNSSLTFNVGVGGTVASDR